jgi:hypothetical protein
MAKQTHQQAQASSSKTAMIALAIGGLVVAGLVGWALTRTVEAPVATTSTAALEQFPSTTAPVPGGREAITDTNSPNAATASAPTATSGAFATPPATTATSAPPINVAAQGERGTVARISAEDLRARVNRGEVTVVDVRDANSYATSHIPGAIHIPFASVEAQLDQIPKGKDIVTYCT